MLNAVPSNTNLVQPYVFIVQNVESGGGGIEHLNSTVVMNQRFSYQNEGSYENFLGLIAHEYFHLWNVKRIRPSELGPFNYNEENYTHSLWIAEGITSYYDELGMMRAGFKSRTEFLNGLAANISNHENRPGARVATLHEMSFDAWIKEYRPNENSKNSTYSYYSKGLIIAAILDAKICKATNGEKSLDDVFKILWNDFYKDKSSTIIGKGYSDEDFRKICEKVAGIDFKSDFDLWLNSTKIPDYVGIFNELGLQAQEKNIEKQDWGLTTAKVDGAVVVKYVNSNGFAQKLGINVNDEIIGINGLRVSQSVESTWQSIQNPLQVQLIVNRSGLLFQLSGEFTPLNEYQFKLNQTAEMNKSEFWKTKGSIQTWLKSN
jgi:predicted metalloprotease with PDZ domain